MKTREEQLEAWIAKRTKPLTAISSNNAANRPPKSKRLAVHSKAPAANLQLSVSQDNKENQCSELPTSAGAIAKKKQALKPVKEDQPQVSDFSDPAHLSKTQKAAAKKAALSASSLQSMENQYDMLKGTLDALKRESIRSEEQPDSAAGLNMQLPPVLDLCTS